MIGEGKFEGALEKRIKGYAKTGHYDIPVKQDKVDDLRDYA